MLQKYFKKNIHFSMHKLSVYVWAHAVQVQNNTLQRNQKNTATCCDFLPLMEKQR